MELRTLIRPLELRAADGGPLRAVGHAAVFNTWTDIGDPMTYGFREQVAPGAFTNTLANDDVVALFNHDMNMLLGRKSAGTLSLSIDDSGLFYDVELPDTTVGRDVGTLLQRGDVRGSSFGFQVIRHDVSYADDGARLRTILEARLFDVSPVTMPAYPTTDAQLRSIVDLAGLPSVHEARVADDEVVDEETVETVEAAPVPVCETNSAGYCHWLWRVRYNSVRP